MKKSTHRIYLSSMVVIVVTSVILLTYMGFGYYRTGLEDRFFLPQNEALKPSGYLGHGFGIAGTLMILIGLFTYMARKRFRILSRLGYLKHWLEFHIFLCILGPIFILFHTSFKFGGIVAISFWSMVAVVLSGVIGRFIYIQIPRTIDGRELTDNELNETKTTFPAKLEQAGISLPVFSEMVEKAMTSRPDLSGKSLLARIAGEYRYDRTAYRLLKRDLRKYKLSARDFGKTRSLLKSELALNRKIYLLVSMRNLMEYWHVAHLPFAMAMLIVMVIHVIVVIALGYKWIF